MTGAVKEHRWGYSNNGSANDGARKVGREMKPYCGDPAIPKQDQRSVREGHGLGNEKLKRAHG